MSRITLSLTSVPEYKQYAVSRFEELFELRYLHRLEFADWQAEQWIRRKCEWAIKKGKVGELAQWLGKLHGKEIENAEIPEVGIRWIDERIGYGLFALRDFKKWEYIGEYTGILRRRPLMFPNINDYCFMYPREWISLKAFTIDSGCQGNYTRFINHRDNPNLESISVLHDGVFHIIFRTIEEIPAGSEMTYDYGDIYWHRRKKRKENE